MNNFVKNPIKGGIPAIDNRVIVNKVVKNGLNLNVLNEYIVLEEFKTICWNMAKIIINEQLYTNK
jgi:hypothetical protein